MYEQEGACYDGILQFIWLRAQWQFASHVYMPCSWAYLQKKLLDLDI